MMVLGGEDSPKVWAELRAEKDFRGVPAFVPTMRVHDFGQRDTGGGGDS